MILKINDRIRNTKVDFFNNVNVELRYDSVASAFSFGFYFDPNDQTLVDLACIGHYHLCTVEHNDELLLSGYLISETFRSSSQREISSFGGYSLPGVLEDCEIPTSLYPLQSDGLTLRQIANKLISPFGLKLVVDSSVASLVDSVYDTSTANESQSIKSYLSELASQKNVILSHTPKGELLFTKAKTKQTPLFFFDGSVSTVSMSLSFNGQAMHSSITVMKQASIDGGNAGESTVSNPFVPFVFRPKVKIQNSGDDNDSGEAARNMLSQELKNIKLTINLDRWEIDGKLIKPNSIIAVKNPEIYLFQKSNWFIESVRFIGDEKQRTATLTCVLPSVYDGSTPSYIFEGINLH